MSFSALTTAAAIAAATVPAGETAPSNTSVDLEQTAPDAGLSDAEAPLVLELAQTEVAPQPSESGQNAPAAGPATPHHAPAGEHDQIIVTGRKASPDDPLEQLNVGAFKVTREVDESVIAPIAYAYEDIMPKPVRKGLRNFLRNLNEPIVFINYLLQLKPDKAAETLFRFMVNTTVGIGGIVDVAKRKPFHLPHHVNGFANTLGYYGVKPGPYFYIPLLGPTTLRDFIGDRLDLFLLPSIYGKLMKREIFLPIAVLSALDHRLEVDENLKAIRASQDPYLAMRTYYLQKRQAEIDALHGRKAGAATPAKAAPRPNGSPASRPSPIHYPPRANWTRTAPWQPGAQLGAFSFFEALGAR